jgi:hypothetical protein
MRLFKIVQMDSRDDNDPGIAVEVCKEIAHYILQRIGYLEFPRDQRDGRRNLEWGCLASQLGGKHQIPLDNHIIIHYGADSLLGFHLTTAYVPLRPTFPLFLSSAGSTLERVVKAAKSKFHLWTISFRDHAQSVNLRIFVGDALAFSHSLPRLNNAHDFR